MLLQRAQRHRLRKHIKRLRYAIEFSAGLFERRPVKRYLKPLRTLQEHLGTISDVVMAIDALRTLPERHARDWFTLGWLGAQRATLIDQAGTALRDFAKVEGFWRSR
jgi:CHAD domain-containing protein